MTTETSKALAERLRVASELLSPGNPNTLHIEAASQIERLLAEIPQPISPSELQLVKRDEMASIIWDRFMSRHGGPFYEGAKPSDSPAMNDCFALADKFLSMFDTERAALLTLEQIIAVDTDVIEGGHNMPVTVQGRATLLAQTILRLPRDRILELARERIKEDARARRG